MKDYLSQIHTVDNDILDTYLSHWKEYSLPKKTFMTKAGETEKYLYYVLEGVQKSYYQAEDGKQHIIAFTYPPSFTGVPESFFNQSPSRYFLETIKDSKFLRIPFETHQKLMQEYREIETLYRKTLEKFLEGIIQRQHELLAFDMETRFRIFVKRSPHLLQMVSQKDLASYLRIDASNFSKLINRINI